MAKKCWDARDAGRQHWQMYFETTCQLSFKQAHANWLPGAHFERRMGTAKQADDNCQDRDKLCVEPYQSIKYGVMRDPGEGARTNLKLLAYKIRKGTPVHQIALEAPDAYVRNYRGMAALENIVNNQTAMSKRDVHCYYLEGPDQTDKIVETFPDAFKLSHITGGKVWWDGYTNQSRLIIDDFYGQIPLREMLHYLKVTRLQIATKGGFVMAQWTVVYVTSTVKPAKWYPDETEANFKLLCRQIP